MESPDKLCCEECGCESPVVFIKSSHDLGNLVSWPKSTVRGDSLYVFIACPTCGEREQCVGPTD
jgi:hypothetical protein